MVYEFKFPDVGEGIMEGEIVSWKVKEGDVVKLDQVLGEVETDKAVVEIPSPKAGIIMKLHFKETETVKVGEVMVSIQTPGESIVAQKSIPGESTIIKKDEEKGSTSVMGSIEEYKKDTSSVKATPVVRALAKEKGINLSSIKGSGPEGRILKEDLEKSSIEKPVEEIPKFKKVRKYDIYGHVKRFPLKGVRKIVAKNMAESWQNVARVTHHDDADVTDLWNLRKKEKESYAKKGIKLTFLPFILKALVEALKFHPYLSSSLDGEDIVIKEYYNFGIAVDTKEGLMVPVLKGVDIKSIMNLAKEIEELATKARGRKLDLGDFKGGTFTVTNVGSDGGKYFVPIVNYPECAILGLGRIYDSVYLENGMLKSKKLLPLSVSFDHRIVDGAEVAKFVNTLKQYLEDIDKLLIED